MFNDLIVADGDKQRNQCKNCKGWGSSKRNTAGHRPIESLIKKPRIARRKMLVEARPNTKQI
jgi:hypothetical protein